MEYTKSSLLLALTIAMLSGCNELDQLKSLLDKPSPFKQETTAVKADTESQATDTLDNDGDDNKEPSGSENDDNDNDEKNGGNSKSTDEANNHSPDKIETDNSTTETIVDDPLNAESSIKEDQILLQESPILETKITLTAPYIIFPAPRTNEPQISDLDNSTLNDYTYEEPLPDHDSTATDITPVVQINNYSTFKLLVNKEGNSAVSAIAFTNLLGPLLEGINLDHHKSVSVKLDELAPMTNWPRSFKAFFNSGAMKSKNQLWGQEYYLFLNDYLDSLKTNFKTEFVSYDFIADPYSLETVIDEWISSETLGAIDQLTPSPELPERTRQAHASANTLSVFWSDTLAVNQTTGLFERLDGEQFQVPMVKIEGELNSLTRDTYTITEIPLGDTSLSLLKIEPDTQSFHQTKDDLANTIKLFHQEKSSSLVTVMIPAFEASSHNSHYPDDSSILSRDLFYESTADLSKINGMGFLYIDSITSKTSLTLSESGITGSNAGVSALLAHKDEPPQLFGSVSTSAFISAGTVDLCTWTYTKAGDPDSLPFYYVVLDNNADTILYLGQLLEAPGEAAGTWECVNNFSDIITVKALELNTEVPPLEGVPVIEPIVTP